MKKILIPVLAGMMSIASMAQAGDTVRIASEGAYAPWNYLDDAGKLAGFEIDLANEMCKEAQLKCEFVANEWDTIIPNLVAGNYDAIMAGMSITEERKKSISFSDEYYPADPSNFVVIKGGKAIDVKNVKGLKIGVQGATIHASYAEEFFKADNTILSYETGDQSIADLMAGNVDTVLADSSYLDPIIEGSKGAIETSGDGIVIGGGVGIGLRQNSADLTAKFNAALEAIKADGRLDKLIQEYFKKGPYYGG